MAARLNVIMAETAPEAGAARRLAESVVGELIGLPGIDLVLVSSLQDLSANSTDRLTLDGVTGDACVMDWRPPEAILDSLRMMGFDGVRSPHAGDREIPSAVENDVAGTHNGNGRSRPNRRIYLFELNRFTEASQIVESLNSVRASRDVRTIPLLAPSSLKSQPSLKAQPGALDASGSTRQPIKPNHPTPVGGGAHGKVPDKDDMPPGNDIPTPDNRAQKGLDSAEIDLDDLVDQLDEFDK